MTRVGGGKMGTVGKWVDFLFLPVLLTQRFSLSVLDMNELVDNTFALFADELFAADQCYSFEIRFFATCSFFL